ncbi:YiiX/YebB-like N1pC/P60 family cysteine hydrolase [Orbaceae bacterium ESL0721]|nr:YiiX/YebB-like N1pC/P60 family cysteine hydrolase [Orbaceae bacterium ESL0721]
MATFKILISSLSLLLWFPLNAWAITIPKEIVEGDLVFRTGDEPISAIIKSVDSSGFSHVGMIFFQDGEPFIIHATPAEHQERKDGVTVDTLDFFISHAIDQSVTYYHVDATADERKQAVAAALTYVGTPFSIDPDQGTYCTELVVNAWQNAGINITTGSKEIHIPGLKSQIIFPDNVIAADRVIYIGSSDN